MKNINSLFLFGILSIIALGFSACSDDDEITNASDLIGLWEPTHAEGYEIWEGDKETWDFDINASTNNADYERIEFLSDGACKSYYYSNGWKSYSEKVTYHLKGNKVIMRDTTEEVTYEYTIVSLTSTRLILERRETGDGEDYYEKVTYKKVD